MDAAGLTILLKEVQADCDVAQDAARKAACRITETAPGHLDDFSYELARLYKVIEQMLQRICESFEDQFAKRDDHSEGLLQHLCPDLESIRPGFISKTTVSDLRGLGGLPSPHPPRLRLTLRTDVLSGQTRIAEEIAVNLQA